MAKQLATIARDFDWELIRDGRHSHRLHPDLEVMVMTRGWAAFRGQRTVKSGLTQAELEQYLERLNAREVQHSN